MMQIRKMVMMQMAGTVSDNNHLECGQFTLSEVSKTYTINHGLGAVPNFCIVYPVNVQGNETAYKIGWELFVRDIGQQDWNVSTKAETHGSVHVMSSGSGYTASVVGYNGLHNAGITKLGIDYAGIATTTTFIVGGWNETNSSGSLLAGTYGYILGILNNQ